MMTTNARRNLIPAALHFLLPLMVYWLTLLPGTGYRGDTAKFQYLGKILGIPHSTGYPQYLLLNHLMGLLPWKEPAYGQNLLSALLGAGAITLLFFVFRRVTGDTLVASAAVLLLAFSRLYWGQSIVAEVYALQMLFFAGIMYCAVRWQQERESRWLAATVFLYALSFGNHASSIFWLPGLFLFIAAVDRSALRRPGFWGMCIGFVTLSLSQYAYLFIRSRSNCPYIEVGIRTAGDFIRFALATKFHGRMVGFSWHDLWYEQTHWFVSLFYFQFFSVGCFLAAVGLWECFCKNRSLFYLTFPAFLFNAIFALGYRVDDAAVFALPCFFLAAFWIVVGMQEVAERFLRRHWRILFFLLIPVLIVSNWSLVDQSENILAHLATERIVRFVPPNSVLVTEVYQAAHYFRYHLWAKGIRKPDENIFVAQEWRPEQLAAYLAGQSPLVECGMEIPLGLHPFFAECPLLFKMKGEKFEPVLFFDYPNGLQEPVLFERVTESQGVNTSRSF
jgi:4-amino-4-deoxy-L-arabinose transferase-like glycosyltransferase